MIVIVDYGVGNVGSIKNMLRKIGKDAVIGRLPEDILSADKLILPGVGAFDTGMRCLKQSGLLPYLNKRVLEDRVHVLGICLGAQMMTRRSDEGMQSGLGGLAAETVRFNHDKLEGKWLLPNIGWRHVYPVKQEYTLMRNFEEIPRFYFVHSYHLKEDKPDIVTMQSEYGYHFTCALSDGNIHCVQFHPEKSHKFGMQLLKNFANLDSECARG